jgi:hypothetical protein
MFGTGDLDFNGLFNVGAGCMAQIADWDLMLTRAAR